MKVSVWLDDRPQKLQMVLVLLPPDFLAIVSFPNPACNTQILFRVFYIVPVPSPSDKLFIGI